MKKILKEIGLRLKNTGTIIAIVSAIILIVQQLGFAVDNTKVMYIVNAICGIGVAIGVLNNPKTKGLAR